MDGVYENHENPDVTGGTGRFAPPATGHFELGGQIDFTTIPPSFVLPLGRDHLNRRLDEALDQLTKRPALFLSWARGRIGALEFGFTVDP